MKAIDNKTGAERDVRTVVVAKSSAEANELREQLRRGAERATASQSSRIRLREYATTWFKNKLPTLKASTRVRYANELEQHILPFLGDFFVDAITAADITSWRDAQQNGASSVNSRLRTLRTLMADAVADLDLPRDPCARVRALREKHRADDDPNCLTASGLAELLSAARQEVPLWHPLFGTLAYTGMRFGEASALRWDDIDERCGLIRIRRAQYRGTVDTTKTGTTRSVPLHPGLRELLLEQRRRLVATQNAALHEGWVFPSATGTLLMGPSAHKPLKRALRAAGITQRFTIHGFRRTFNNLIRQVTRAKCCDP